MTTFPPPPPPPIPPQSSPPTPPPPYQELPHPHQSASISPAPSPSPSPSPFPSPFPFPAPIPASAPSLSPGPTSSVVETYNDWKLPLDPRSSSTQSLHPADVQTYAPSPSLSSSTTADPRGRRTLLVIYLHGFLGNDESFRSFPAHVHALLTSMLSDSHVIHTKLYPRYKTYRAVDVARDNFSEWLTPHESPTTDVIIVGHSMGGILAADIVLMPNMSPYAQYPFKHRILGHVSLDCPFLGLHPGIIVSGISSLFKPSPQPQQQPPVPDGSGYNLAVDDGLGGSITTAGSSSLNLTTSQSSAVVSSSSSASISSSLPPSDPHFNAPFFNDAVFREQPFVRRALHFVSKYRDDNLFSAVTKHFMSYLEYGGVLADPAGLDSRYCHLRALEDVDELQPSGLGKDPQGPTTRVRFVNYYTLCTGLPKTPKSETPKSEFLSAGDDEEEEVDLIGPQNETTGATVPVAAPAAAVTVAGNTTASHPVEDIDMLEPKSLFHEKVKLQASHHGSRPSITVQDHDKSLLFAGSSAPNLGTCSGTQSPDPTSQDTTSLPGDLDELSMQEIDPTPMDESSDPSGSTTLQTRPSDQSFELDLPPIPDEPTPPELPDLDQYFDKDSRKLAEREAKRLQRVYEQAMKDRSKAMHEREKIVEKRRRKASKDADRLAKGARKEAEKEEKEARKEMERLEKESRKQAERVEKEARKEAERKEKEAQKEAERKDKEALKEQRRLEKEAQDMERAALAAAAAAAATAEARTGADGKPRKLRQFCNLPDKAPTANGGYERDATWVEVFMADVDEVGAHCGLFLPGPHYERLVGDVGSRIVGWVQEDMTKRAIMDIGVD